MTSRSRSLVGTQHVPQCFCCRQAIQSNDNGILRCGFCPKSYHYDCLPNDNKPPINSKSPRWGCPSHKCQCALSTSAMKKGEKMLTCVTCPRSYCLKCIEGCYTLLERSKIWNKMSERYATIQCSKCLMSEVDLGGFFSSDFATEDLQSDQVGSQKDTSLREQIADFIHRNRLKQEDVAKAIDFSAGTLSLYLKGDTRKRGWGNLEEKLSIYIANYETESNANSDQHQNISNTNHIRIAVPRDVYNNDEREVPQQESFDQLIHPDEYMVPEINSTETNMDFRDQNDIENNYGYREYAYSPQWSYPDPDPSNTNLGIHSTAYNHSKDDTEHNNNGMEDGSYSY
eukprot:TRINITY_DN3111_c0_g1_i1.p1 TRINITY_DN3111_c0_g1~~TRINITY_DN3111_c0_g1_i1.p1  ORF type:complete len:342 (-),score=-12.94 TRINITY_DN3111_c0_g1_i1:16-1041(-)